MNTSFLRLPQQQGPSRRRYISSDRQSLLGSHQRSWWFNVIKLHEGHAMADHIHICLSIPPKYSVSNTIGFIKGKSAIRIHRELLNTKRMTGLSFWAKGYCVSTVGLDEETIRKYIRDQNKLNED